MRPMGVAGPGCWAAETPSPDAIAVRERLDLRTAGYGPLSRSHEVDLQDQKDAEPN